MKRRIFIGFLSLFMIVGMVSMVSAEWRVTETNQLGSLLVFPKIVTENPVPYKLHPLKYSDVDTVVSITNTSAHSAVRVKCMYVWQECAEYACLEYSGDVCVNYADGEVICHCGPPGNYHPCEEEEDVELSGGKCEYEPNICVTYAWPTSDCAFTLTPRETYWFSADSGEGSGTELCEFPGEQGELKCWAVDTNDNQIRWNYLKGEAIIADFDFGLAGKYNAYGFQVRGVKNKGIPGTPGLLELNAAVPGYDACPDKLWFNIFATDQDHDSSYDLPGRPVANDITLIPCKQDLRQEGEPTVTKAIFEVWDENEGKLTGIDQCVACFWESLLVDPSFGLGPSQGTPLDLEDLGTDAASIRVDGIASARVCDGFYNDILSTDSPLLGLHIDRFVIGYHNAYSLEGIDADSPEGRCMIKGGMTITTPHGEGIETTGFIAYDPRN